MKSTAPRWKLLIILLALPFIALAVFRQTSLEETGWGGVASILAVILALIMALLWLIGLSGLPWSLRGIGTAVLAALGGLLATSVRVDGHMGDFFPQLAWKWSPKSDEVADKLEPSATPSAIADTAPSSANDFPRFLGPEGTNWIPGESLPANWANQTPRQLWSRDIGLGWSSFAVSGPYAYTMEQRIEQELTVCYEARTGNPVWVHDENVRFSESMGGDGPRSTPVIHEGRVYSLGATGILLCLDRLTGEVLWRRDTLAETDQGNLTWAKSGSPIIVDDTVVVTLGRSKESLAAYDLATGEPRWQAGEDSSSYATPIVGTVAGKRQLVAFNSKTVSGHDPTNGQLLWSHETDGSTAHAASPVLIGDNQVLVSIGYGKGAWLVQIEAKGDQFVAEEVWQSNKLKAKFADMVLYKDHVYGLDEGRLVCVELAEGQRVWRGSKFRHGQMLGVGDKLVVQAESGEIVIVEATPEEQRIIHRFDALSSKTWNHPVLAGNLLLVRNDREAIVYAYE